MPYGGPHTLVTITGSYPVNVENWSFGMRFSGSPPLTQAMADSTAAAAKAWFTTAATGYRPEQSIDHVKVAPIGVDGKYPPGLDALEANISGGQGTNSSGQPQVPQVALAMTLTTDVPRGIAHNTHVFLPAPCYGLSVTAGLSPANAALFLDRFKLFVLALNAIGYGSLGVESKKYGQRHTVTGLRLGLVYDTMRSRRRSIQELPVSLAL